MHHEKLMLSRKWLMQELTNPAGSGIPFSRRELLRVGGAGLMGISLAKLLGAAEDGGKPAGQAPGLAAKADSCIIMMLNGGPSHLDMWDMKPDAPDNIRGEFKPIPST